MSGRTCPSCNNDLVEEEFHKTMIDRCPHCRGIFFDAGELESILEIVDLFNSIALKEDDLHPSEAELRRQLCCPVDGESFEKHEIGGQIIDICPECRGIWLDDGELFALKIAEEHITSNLNLYIRLGQ